jgi:hypothetical protein
MSYYAVIREAGPAWTDGGITKITSIEPWNIFVGAEAHLRRRRHRAGRVNISPQPRAGDAAHRSPPSGQTNRHRHLQ